jgi:predicted AlkP superfamily pyrophosphatase or phosphodiesterase
MVRSALVHKTAVLNVVGLTPKLLQQMPRTQKFAREGRIASIGHVLPAVTCPVQATYLTGTPPREHGIVSNGWYFRDECEVKFWRQSDKLVQRPRIWEVAKRRDSSFTCANLFWWHAMYSSADVTVTPRPMYPSDGRKIPDVWTNPPQLRFGLQEQLGPFPLFQFWGPGASIGSSRWIARAAIEVDRLFEPTLTLVYLPHLDYPLQRFGPDDSRISAELLSLDGVVGQLIEHFRGRGARVVILSEYGIEPVFRPIHLNRLLRTQKLTAVREELGRELLDAGASEAFAVADHQVAHVYVNDPQKIDLVAPMLKSTPGVAEVLDRAAQRERGIDHERSGEFVVVAEPGAWFTYYYWLDDAKAPDFARTVDIHRKPGYDPVELFMDPKIRRPQARVAWSLLKRRMGFRTLLNVVPLDGALVRGSHGRPPASAETSPLIVSSHRSVQSDSIEATQVMDVLLAHVFD